MNKKAFYITTPIYYPSGHPHIGHAYCTTLCDILARYKRMLHVDTFFLTGTDEHGLKIEKNAALASKTPLQFVDEIAANFKKLWTALEISNDDFIRTTEERHKDVVQYVFSEMLAKGDIYLGSYNGWYCTPCESFWTDTQVGEEHLCPDCGRKVEMASEDAYFFRLKNYLEPLLKLFEKDKFIEPESRKNEMLNTFIKPGLEDLCVSRTSFSWGIPVIEDPKHIVYVWVDALFNYLTALNYHTSDDSLYQKFWANEDSEIVHVVGADITRFHTIYWPEFLMSMGLRVPNRVFVHGLLMMKDGKMSKSKGNVISPFPLIEKYGVDTVRYYLAREVIFGQNGQFTPEQFVERTNMDLANNYGNLVSRTISMVIKYFDGVVPSFKEGVLALDKELEILTKNTISAYQSKMDNLEVTEALMEVEELLNAANKYIEDSTPWVLAKDETKLNELASVMAHLSYIIYVSTKLLSPVIVNKTRDVFEMLGVNDKESDFNNIANVNILNNKKVSKKDVLFPRLDVKEEVEYIKSLMPNK